LIRKAQTKPPLINPYILFGLFFNKSRLYYFSGSVNILVRQLFYELGLQMGRLRVKIGTQVKVAYWLLGIALIIVHGIWPNQFKVDEFSVLIYFILSIPFVAQYLIKAKFPGGEFIFRDKIEKAEELVQKSIEIAEEAERDGKTKPLPFETFQLSQVREVLEYDQVLALAALRIEIERKLRLLGVFLKISEKKWPGFVGQLFLILKWCTAHRYAAASSLGSVSQ